MTKWQCQYVGKLALKEDFRDELEKGWTLLKTLSASEIAEEKEEAVVLALYLNRKKLLAVRKETSLKEKGFSLYEHLENGEALLVPKLDLFSLSIPAVQERLKKKLT